MIYIVEISFTNADAEAEWNEWYTGHLHTLLTVPGIDTAQRFKLEAGVGPTYVAVYSVASPAVYSSQAYRDIGGGGVASRRFSSFIARRRNLYEGIGRLPEVSDDHRLLIVDEAEVGVDVTNILFASLRIAALDGAPVRRLLAIAPQVAADAVCVKDAQARTYRPITSRLTSGR